MDDLRYGKQSKHEITPPTRADINLATAYYIMNGGTITKLKSGTAQDPVNLIFLGRGTKHSVPYVSAFEDEENLSNNRISLRTNIKHLTW